MAWLAKFCNTFRPGRLSRELEEELQLHLDLKARDLSKAGMPEISARQEAVLRLGNLTLQQERMHDMNIASGLETVGKDLRYGLRQLFRHPVFTAVAVLSLALGIGANTAIFSIFNAVLLKSLPVSHPNELVMLTNPNESGVAIGSSSGERAFLTYAEYLRLRDESASGGILAGLCATQAELHRLNIRLAGGSQEQARGRLVSEDYFSVLGVEPFAGRFFAQKDAAGIGSDPYAVISYDYWQRRFAGNRAALGTSLRLYGAVVSIIGIAPPGFHGETVGNNPDLWLPMMMQPLVMPGRDWIHEDLSKSIDKVEWLHVFGRLQHGITLNHAQTALNARFKIILADGYPQTLAPSLRKDLLDQHIKVRAARTGAFGGRDELSRQLILLLIIAGLVLLIACANVANLLFARATARRRETGVRLSIGAGQGRLIRQFLTESLLLSALGGLAGILVALGATRLLLAIFGRPSEPLAASAAFDWSVLAFTLAVTLATGILFGLAPALRGTRVDLADCLKESSRAVTETGRSMTISRSLVSLQVALSVLLVVGAGLFLRTLWNLQSVTLGYSKENLVSMRVDALTAGYKDAQRPPLFEEIAGRFRAVAGVRSVAYSENGFFEGTESGDSVDVEGFVHKTKEDSGSRFDQVGPRYFSTLGLPILLGREIDARDTAGSLRVCVVNEAFVKRFFAGRNPLGKHIVDTYGGGRISLQIVGVVGNVRDHGLRGEIPERFYLPITQPASGPMAPSVYFEVRTNGDPERVIAALRKTVVQVHPSLATVDARRVSDLIDEQNRLPRMIARLCCIFGALALVLAGIGLYGVLSYSVARRTNEIGIRMALGAGKRAVVHLIVKETGLVIAIGLVAGVLATLAVTRLVASQLYGLEAHDPLTIFAAVVILGSVSLVAAYLPAARAARISPVTALRHE